MIYDLFISYSRRDNERGQVAALKAQIETSFRAFAGRDLRVFFDTQAIAGMDDWRQKIQRSLRESHLFLAVLSPNYLASPYCRWEWEDYVRYEAMRQCLGEGVAPVFFVTLPAAATPQADQAIARWIDEINHRQAFDLRPWHDRGEQALHEAHVRATLDQLHTAVRDRLDRAERARRSPNNLIKHNPAFVGRVRELTELRHALSRNQLGVVGAHAVPGSQPSTLDPLPSASQPGRATVQGLGGMGKTELALAYAHAFAWDYPGGRWQIPCEHTGDLRLALSRLAGPMHFEFTEGEKKDFALQFERVLRELQRREQCLLILDNVSDPHLLEPEYLDRLPRDGHVDLIATTRLAPAVIPGAAHETTFIAVDELPEEDALALMRSHQPEGRFASPAEDDEARQIVRLLRGFTLAVETAAIYLGRHPAPDACRQFRERLSPDLLRESEQAATDPTVAVRHRVRSLDETLAFTFETLSPESRQILLIASMLPADQITLPWLRAVAMHDFPQFTIYGGTEADEAWKRNEHDVCGLRLFTPGQDARIVRMHRMVQDLVARREGASVKVPDTYNEAVHPTSFWSWFGRFRAKPVSRSRPQTQAAQEAVAGHESPLIANTRGNLIAHILDRGSYLFEQWVNSENRWEIEPLCATALHWMEANEIAGAMLAQSIEQPLSRLCLWTDSELLLRRALQLYERHFGPRHERVGIACNNLAEVLRGLGRPAEAEGFHRRALQLLDKGAGGDNSTVGQVLNNRALALAESGRFREAEPLYRRAIAIAEAAHGPDHIEVARALSNLAGILCETSRAGEAEASLRRALLILEKQNGANHPLTTVCRNNLAGVLDSMGRVDEAEALYRQALAADEATFGRAHSMTALRMHNLAHVLFEKRKFAEAEPLLREAIAAQEDKLPPNHPELASTLMELGTLLGVLGDTGGAESHLRRALAIFRQAYDSDHPRLAACVNNLAGVLYKSQRITEAEPLYQECLQIHARWSVKNRQEHPRLSQSASDYHTVLRRVGHTEEEARRLVKATVAQEGIT